LPIANLIWNDPVKSEQWSSMHFVISFRVGFRETAVSEVAESTVATVDHSDIRGSEPHNRDPSGAASD
jgi:hypothetical protein